MPKILFIHPRKGLFQLTYCQNCGHVFECQNCTAKLTTYSAGIDQSDLEVCLEGDTVDQAAGRIKNYRNSSSNNLEANHGDGMQNSPSSNPTGSNSASSKVASTAVLDFGDFGEYLSQEQSTQTHSLVSRSSQNQKNKQSHGSSDSKNHKVFKTLNLTCHQCQTYYKYPNRCPSCQSEKIISKYSGIDDLEKVIQKFGSTKRLDLKNNIDFESEFDLTTRVFDPSLDYSRYDYIVFIQAENLDANIDYLTQEEAVASLTKLISSLSPQTKIIFDTTHITDLINQLAGSENLAEFVSNSFREELKNRDRFHFPPFENIILITTQENSLEKSQAKIQAAQNYLKRIKENFEEIRISSPYPARFLKRKGKYSHHITVKYPRNYKKFFLLKEYLSFLIKNQHLQARINPRHLF